MRYGLLRTVHVRGRRGETMTEPFKKDCNALSDPCADSSPVRERRDEVHPSPQQRAEAPLQEKAIVRLRPRPGVFLPDGPAQPAGIFRAGDELRIAD